MQGVQDLSHDLEAAEGGHQVDPGVVVGADVAQDRGLTLTLARVVVYPNYGAGTEDAMKIYKGTITPNRQNLNDARSSGPASPKPKSPVLNDRRSTR